MSNAPDMRVFNTAVANDHAVYDACLVRAFQKYSTWTRANFTDVPVGQEHFVEHTRGRVIDVLKQELSLSSSFGSGNKTFVPTDLAYRMVRELGGRYHVQRDPMDTSLDEITAGLHMNMKAGGVVAEPSDHPLNGHFRAYSERIVDVSKGGDMVQKWIKKIDLQPEETRVVTALNAMTREQLTGILGRIQPFLTERDDAHIRSPLLELRNRLRKIVEQNFELTNPLRRQLFEIAYEDWKKNLDLDDIERANADLAEETGDPKILESTIDDILRRGFIDPLAKDVEDKAGRKEQLLRRKIILESLFQQMIDERKWEHVDLLTKAHDAYVDHLGLKVGELGYLAITNITMSTKIDSLEKMTNALH